MTLCNINTYVKFTRAKNLSLGRASVAPMDGLTIPGKKDISFSGGSHVSIRRISECISTWIVLLTGTTVVLETDPVEDFQKKGEKGNKKIKRLLERVEGRKGKMKTSDDKLDKGDS